ncbi:hypothetical protein SDC9_151736 [bioreactor metagenome]|uniref:Uncharacterized protein n=1 Tax=bioreactor metagenome TaxID=1076179 RepID=A0A645ER33_9ZZZZ
MNAENETIANTNPKIIIKLLYPISWPFVTHINNETIATKNKNAPLISNFSFTPSLDLGKNFIPNINIKIPIGTLIKNMYCQLATDTMKPPSGGPTSVPSATNVPDIPSARPLSSAGNTCVIIP